MGIQVGSPVRILSHAEGHYRGRVGTVTQVYLAGGRPDKVRVQFAGGEWNTFGVAAVEPVYDQPEYRSLGDRCRNEPERADEPDYAY